MRIGVIGALAQELAHLQATMADVDDAGDGVLRGTLHGHQLLLVRAGVGKVAAAVTTTLLIERHRPRLVVNTGAAGALDPALAVHDIVLATELRQHDVDLVGLPDSQGRPHAPGQLYDGPTHFAADPGLLATAMTAAARALPSVAVHRGPVCTGDAFIHRTEQADLIGARFPGTLAVEMEGAAVAQTAALLGVPALVVRAISDRVGGGEGPADFARFLDEAGRRAAALVAAMVTLLDPP